MRNALNRILCTFAAIGLALLLIVNIRSFFGHDPMRGGGVDEAIWWAMAGCGFVVFFGLPLREVYATRQGTKWASYLIRVAQFLSVGEFLVAIFLIPHHVHAGVYFYPSGGTRAATPKEIFFEHVAGMWLWSAVLLQVFIYPVLYLLSGRCVAQAKNIERRMTSNSEEI